MSAPLRLRFFLWLALSQFIFFLLQGLFWAGYELYEWATKGEETLLHELGEILIPLAVGTLCFPIMLAVTWRIARRMLAPLQAIARTAERIHEGRLDERIRGDFGDDELGLLAVTLNEAFDRYREALDRLNRFSSDASHQLRTPLTAIRSTGEVALQKPRTDAEYRESIGSMLEDVARLSRIVEQLLALARLDAGSLRGRFERVDLHTTIERVSRNFEPLWDAKALRVVRTGGPGLDVMGDADLLEQVVANLIDNATRHTPAGGDIRIQAERDGAWITLTLADTGPGIAPEHRLEIFDRFRTAPGHVSPGAGLGLAIVADIVAVHRGAVRVDAASCGGASFQIRLPTA